MLKPISFSAGGVDYQFKFGTNEMVKFEERTGGVSIMAAAEAFQSDAPLVCSLRDLFWAGISPEVEPQAAGEIMDELGFGAATSMIGEALERAFEGLEAPDPENPRKAPEASKGGGISG